MSQQSTTEKPFGTTKLDERQAAPDKTIAPLAFVLLLLDCLIWGLMLVSLLLFAAPLLLFAALHDILLYLFDILLHLVGYRQD